jgi:uncharacterized membrane protein
VQEVNMVKMEKIQIFKCPVEKVFTFITDMKNLTQWETNMSDVEILTPVELGVGSKFRGKANVMGMRTKWIAEIIGWNPNKRYTERISSGSSLIDVPLLFEPVETGTKLTMVREMRMGGFLKLLSPFTVNVVRKQSDESFQTLKNII